MTFELINDDTAEVLFVTEQEAASAMYKDGVGRWENDCLSVIVGDSTFEFMREKIGGDFLMKYYDWFNRK